MDAGFGLDRTLADSKTMSKVKALIQFSGYTAAELAPAAQGIHDQMAANAATFASPPVTMAALQALMDDFSTKLAAKASRATADLIAFNIARTELDGALSALGGYVNFVARGDPTIVGLSGFPSYSTARTPAPATPAAPADLRLLHGTLSGQFIARYRPDRSPSMNEVQTCTGDPNVEANWSHAGTFSGGKATVGGIAPGTTVWVRVRTCGNKGVMGAWSDPAKIVVV